jgi:hypothetical protein
MPSDYKAAPAYQAGERKEAEQRKHGCMATNSHGWSFTD